MGIEDLHCAKWRVSTYSASGSTCVEVARNLPGLVAVRDSKNPKDLSLSSPCTRGGRS